MLCQMGTTWGVALLSLVSVAAGCGGKVGATGLSSGDGPDNCAGCCIDANTCGDGLTEDACGTGGGLCQGCKTCVAQDGGGGLCNGVQSCTKDTCLGCCNGDACELGTTDAMCGGLGNACGTCPAGQSCVDGECQSPPFCSAQSCSTCCNGNQCAAGDTDQVCGEQSEPCQDCAAMGLVCQNHQCVEGCSTATCTGGSTGLISRGSSTGRIGGIVWTLRPKETAR